MSFFNSIQIQEFSERSPIFDMSKDEKIKMEMLMRNLKCNLAIAKNYQNKAEETLQSLQSGLKIYLIKEGVLAAGSTTLFSIAVGSIFAGE